MGMKFDFKVKLIDGEIIESSIESFKTRKKTKNYFWNMLVEGWLITGWPSKGKKVDRFISPYQIKEVEVFIKK